MLRIHLSVLRITCIVLFSLLVKQTDSQTVVWSMPPSNYSEITRLGEDLYKVVQNGKIGLIHADGSIIENVENESIIGYYEDKALLIKKDSYGERISGCLTSEGKYYKFHKPYYTLSGQKFYSEGMLSVENENGDKGYVNRRGDKVLGFDWEYNKIKPFSEGHTVVFIGEKSFLIDKHGKAEKIVFPKVAKVGAITNIYNGIAYVWDDGGVAYTYDVSKEEGTRLVKVKNPASVKADYLFRLSYLTNADKQVPFIDVENHGNLGITADYKDGLYGYFSDKCAILPYQKLSSAGQFEDGYAVVGIDGKLGILKLEQGIFSFSIQNNPFAFHEGEHVTCNFNLSMPPVWSGKATLQLADETGSTIPLENLDETYSFKVNPSSTLSKQYNLSIRGEGLTLFETSFVCSFTKKEICATCGKDIEDCEYKGKHPTVPKIKKYIHH